VTNAVPAPQANPTRPPFVSPRNPPFDALTAEAFELAAGALEIAYFPQGTRILSADGAPSDALYVVRKGLVRLERGGETSAVLEEGDFFGYSVVTGQVSADVVVEEDLLAYRVPETVVRRLLAFAPFTRFFTQGLAARLRHQPAFSAEPALGGDVLLPVGSIVVRPPVTIRPGPPCSTRPASCGTSASAPCCSFPSRRRSSPTAT
jgi:CBS domain-containing protein